MPAAPPPAPRRLLEVSQRRGCAVPSPLQSADAAVVAASGVTDRDLTPEESVALVLAQGPASTPAKIYKPETLKRNAVLLRKYERVVKRSLIDVPGVELYVRAVLLVQAHRRGLGRRTVTAESLIDNTCRVIARLWRVQNKALTVPDNLAYSLKGFQEEALRTLNRSVRTTPFCDELCLLFMRALARECLCRPCRCRCCSSLTQLCCSLSLSLSLLFFTEQY